MCLKVAHRTDKEWGIGGFPRRSWMWKERRESPKLPTKEYHNIPGDSAKENKTQGMQRKKSTVSNFHCNFRARNKQLQQ